MTTIRINRGKHGTTIHMKASKGEDLRDVVAAMDGVPRQPNVAELQAHCDAFNAKHAIGTRVRVRLDSGEVRETATRSVAEVLSGHSAVIWLDGIAGCYLLDRVTAIGGAA